MEVLPSCECNGCDERVFLYVVVRNAQGTCLQVQSRGTGDYKRKVEAQVDRHGVQGVCVRVCAGAVCCCCCVCEGALVLCTCVGVCFMLGFYAY
jgi:hypothetical protein